MSWRDVNELAERKFSLACQSLATCTCLYRTTVFALSQYPESKEVYVVPASACTCFTRPKECGLPLQGSGPWRSRHLPRRAPLSKTQVLKVILKDGKYKSSLCWHEFQNSEHEIYLSWAATSVSCARRCTWRVCAIRKCSSVSMRRGVARHSA